MCKTGSIKLELIQSQAAAERLSLSVPLPLPRSHNLLTWAFLLYPTSVLIRPPLASPCLSIYPHEAGHTSRHGEHSLSSATELRAPAARGERRRAQATASSSACHDAALPRRTSSTLRQATRSAGPLSRSQSCCPSAFRLAARTLDPRPAKTLAATRLACRRRS